MIGEIWRFGDLEIWGFGDLEIWRVGDCFHVGNFSRVEYNYIFHLFHLEKHESLIILTGLQFLSARTFYEFRIFF